MISGIISAAIAIQASIKAVDYPPLPFIMPKQFKLALISHSDVWIAGLYVIIVDYKTSLSHEEAYALIRQKTHANTVPSKHGELDLMQATTGMSLYFSIVPKHDKDPVHIQIWLYPYTFEPRPKIWWKKAISSTPPYGPLVAPFDKDLVATSVCATKEFKPTGIRDGYVFTAHFAGTVSSCKPRFDKMLMNLQYVEVPSQTHEVEYRTDSSKVYKIGLGSGKSRPGPLGKDVVYVSWFVAKRTSKSEIH